MKTAVIPNFRLYGTKESTGANLFFNVLRLGQQGPAPAAGRHAAHRHAQLHEVVWLSAGQLTLTIDETTYSLGPNTLSVIAAGSVHEARASADVEGFLLHFSADFLLVDSGEAGFPLSASLYGTPPQLINSTAAAGRLQGLFERLEEEFARVSRERNELIQHYLRILLLELQRETGAESAGRDEAGQAVTTRFTALVEQHYATKKQVSDYAELLHLTPNYLNAVVKHATGRPAGQLIRDRVILEAKRLFLFSEASVSEVAYALNYDDVSYFWRLFKKAVHVSPSAFKKQGHRP